MIRLYIIRHGKTVWNRESRLQGNADIELLEESRVLAEKACARYSSIPFECIFSSPLMRAYETGTILKGDRDIPVIKDERLRELNFGILEGKTYDEASVIFPPFKYFFTEPWLYEKPPMGESLEELYKRAGDFIAREIEPKNEDGREICFLITAHGAINAALSSCLRGEGVMQFWGRGLQDNLQAAVFEYDGKSWKELN